MKKKPHSNLLKIGVIKIELFPIKIFLSFVYEIPSCLSHLFCSYPFEGGSALHTPLCLCKHMYNF